MVENSHAGIHGTYSGITKGMTKIASKLITSSEASRSKKSDHHSSGCSNGGIEHALPM